MRPVTDRPPRRGRALVWVGLALLAVFAALVGVRLWLQRVRYGSDAELLAELADATFDDDPEPASDWPGWRGARRDGITAHPALLDKWPDAGPKRLWTVDGGDGFSSFAIDTSAAYTMIRTADEKEAVVSYDLANGKERWRHTYEPGQVFDYGGPRATPSVTGGLLWTVSPAGRLMCLTTAKGEVVWERDLRQELDGRPPRWGYAFSPLVEGGLVYAVPGGSNGRALAAFRKDTGELAWSSQDASPGYSSPVAATVGGRRQVIFLTGTKLVGVTPDEGKLLWSFDWKAEFEVNAATPVVIHGKDKQGNRLDWVFISSGYKRGCALVKVEARGERFVARPVYTSSELRAHFASPVRHQGHLYAFDEEEDLTCWDIRTGQVAWRFDRGGEGASSIRRRVFRKGALIRVNDKLVAFGDTGKLALVAADPKEYREISAFLAFRGAENSWAMPAFAHGKLLVRDRKRVMCLELVRAKEKP